MGIVNCSNEFAGTYANPLDDPLISTHFSAANPDSIPSVVRRLIRRSKEEGRSTQSIAQQLAEDKSRELNPIVGHRAFDIVGSVPRCGKVKRG